MVREAAERAYFALALALGRMLRGGRYATARIVQQDGELRVLKHRRFYAPLLVWLGGPLVRMLDTGMRVLPQREWEERERSLYRTLYGMSIRVDADGTLTLPCLPGKTLAALLDDLRLEEADRMRAIALAAAALADFHRQGFTHGDAMAENVLVDLEAGAAHWFDFETIHDPSRPLAWRRADDVRALLATCAVWTAAEKISQTVDIILDACADEEIVRIAADNFGTVIRRPLAFHLGQAPLSFRSFRNIDRLLRKRAGG
jgi:hypothetical protein